jgi:hypothetical protein
MVPGWSNRTTDRPEAEKHFFIFVEVGGLLLPSCSIDTPVITRFWPNQEMGRKRDGLGRLHVEDL